MLYDGAVVAARPCPCGVHAGQMEQTCCYCQTGIVQLVEVLSFFAASDEVLPSTCGARICKPWSYHSEPLCRGFFVPRRLEITSWDF